jgi:sugar phosphate isomerase/epimerase
MIAVSNLAWPLAQEAAAFASLGASGVQGVEVAPTRIAPWDDLDAPVLADYRRRIADAGLAVSSLQAILFGRPDLQLLDDDPGPLIAHISRVVRIAAALGARVLVFGAPRNRLAGPLTAEAANARACTRLAALGAIAAAEGVVIGVEPVPAAYQGEFLTTWQEVHAMVKAVAHPGIGVHLDTACVMLGGGSIGEAIVACAPVLCHFHIAEPALANFKMPAADHPAAATALAAVGYCHWCAVEMRETPEDAIGALGGAIDFVRIHYGQA